ncbi:MAG: hydrogenase maturation nickel metallochaperone HypA [Lachnospiraceae bacterium]|nr:hydrogenase maturation nickel metallochaperone HypA [Lachnospiraceae bacterium]
MHELGVIVDVVEKIERIAAEQGIEEIEALVLQIGELSSMIPKYMQSLYPAATEGTILEHSRLDIEIIPGNGRCRNCNQIFSLMQEKGVCPSCGEHDFELLSGKEFMIKEILCY